MQKQTIIYLSTICSKFGEAQKYIFIFLLIELILSIFFGEQRILHIFFLSK